MPAPIRPMHPQATASQVKAALLDVATAERAMVSKRFFKTGPGQYSEGDVFIGVAVPEQRKIVRTFQDLPLPHVATLLQSKVHEERMTALLILVRQYELSETEAQAAIVKLYLDSTAHINNWDLVDASAPYVLGHWLLNKDRAGLFKLAKSKHLWERRIAMVASYAFIRKGEADDALALATVLLNDNHDLMHKAVGWMLREVGKRVDLSHLRGFLAEHAATMPRTTLRYAIEHLPPEERQHWMRRIKK